MNAVGLYVATTRYVLLSNPHDPDSWSDLYRYLPYLRQALSCCVCTNVLCVPMGPIDTICQHHVCKDCIGGKMRLRPSCSWCKDYHHFVENTQLRIIVQCFKGMCEYLSTTAIARNLANTNNGGTNALMTIIRDGRNIKDNYSHTSQSPGFALFPNQNRPPGQSSHAVSQGEGHSDVRRSGVTNSDDNIREQHRNGNISGNKRESSNKTSRHLDNGQNNNYSNSNNHDTELTQRISQTVAQEHDYNKQGSENAEKQKTRRTEPAEAHQSPRRRSRHGSSFSASTSDGFSDDNGLQVASGASGSASETRKPRGRAAQKKPKLKIGCRCGLATPTPGKLTCCGQRCPCYSSFKGCIPYCRCRGCRNPRQVPEEYLQSSSKQSDNATNSESDDSEIEIDI